MSYQALPVGRDIPNDVNVIIEIPMNSPAVKYEVDKASGALFLNRMLKTAMHYPCNYGYIPHTLCGDGDPTDVMVVMPVPVNYGAVVTCRPVGVLLMEDESGEDAKILAVPTEDVTGLYRNVRDVDDVDEGLPELTQPDISSEGRRYSEDIRRRPHRQLRPGSPAASRLAGAWPYRWPAPPVPGSPA